MELILKQCKSLFREEWGHVVDQYNRMRDGLYTAEQSLFLAEGQKFFLESEVSELKAYIAEHRPKYMPDYVQDFQPDAELSQMAIDEANCVFERPLNFYGGYLMQMLYKKKEVLTDETVKKLMRTITGLE